ncbi:HupE/UreJ family protein [Pseudorhodoferax sp.]|uniref:HupE/UreJ family protein n=1 Tax=Pseudorhodoferax sp. TaxID=1993553 RepID=UPI002DD6480C|nr:HupE/UreJ family protein [Pseudorhodoferax sp.]
MSWCRVARRIAAAAAALPAGAAWAHGEIKGVGAFYSGVLHPYISPAHLIALVALGLLFGQRGVQASRHAMGALVAALALGLWLSLRLQLPEPDPLLLALGTLFGLCVVLARQLPAWALVPLAALAGLAVGLGSAPDGMAPAQRSAALLGTLVGATLCAACLAGLVQPLQQPWARVGVRVLGSWLSASAILVLTLALARPAGL